MEEPNKHDMDVFDEYLIASEKYYKSNKHDDEELDVNSLSLGSHS